MRRKRESLRYEPLYKPKPTNTQPQEERAKSRGWAAALLAKLTFGLLEKRHGASILDKPLK